MPPSQRALPPFTGGEPVSTTPGEQLDFAAAPAASSAAASESADSAASSETEAETDQRLESLNTLMSALDSYGMLGDATRMEFADTEEMAFLYQDRISVLLGTLNELDYKLKLAQYVLLNQDGKGCAATDTGLLDLSHLSASSTRKFRFAQGEPTLPSGYLVPEVSTPEETPVENSDAAEADPPADAELSAETSAAPEADLRPERKLRRRKKQQIRKPPIRDEECITYETGTTDGGCALYPRAGHPGDRSRGYHL